MGKAKKHANVNQDVNGKEVLQPVSGRIIERKIPKSYRETSTLIFSLMYSWPTKFFFQDGLFDENNTL